jgi:predicted rRNA methylase YqxC with S4 and FtsJ domains
MVLSSITISATVSVLSTIAIVPAIPIAILSAISAILTGISSRFDFHHKKAEIKGLIEKQNKIKFKLDYVVSCNGDLTQAEYDQILKDFNW